MNGDENEVMLATKPLKFSRMSVFIHLRSDSQTYHSVANHLYDHNM